MTFASQASERDQHILEAVTQPYDPAEQEAILRVFTKLLAKPTEDGGRKRAARTKVHWSVDPGHEAAFYRHLERAQAGELRDADSNASPWVHVAWRALAIAAQQEMRSLSQDPPLGKDEVPAFPNEVCLDCGKLRAQRGVPAICAAWHRPGDDGTR